MSKRSNYVRDLNPITITTIIIIIIILIIIITTTQEFI